MTHLNIQQGSNVEIVTALIIKKLYDAALSVPEPLEGELDAAYMSGNLLVNKAYRSLVEYLTSRFDDLNINVTVGYYIDFEDSILGNKLISVYSADGVGITEAEAANIVIRQSDIFAVKNNVTSFNEFNKFTKANTVASSGINSRFRDFVNMTSINLTALLYLNGNDFRNTGITVVNAPNLMGIGLLSGDNVFGLCTNLTTVESLGNITTLPGSCFDGCTHLTTVNLPQSCIVLNGGCFRGCTNLTSVDLSNITAILGTSAFDGCGLSGELNIPNLTGILGNKCFKDTKITSITNLGNITAISPNSRFGYGEGCFQGCSSLTSVTFPNTLTILGACAFGGCNNLSLLGDLSNITTIGAACFENHPAWNFILNLPNVTAIDVNFIWKSRGSVLTRLVYLPKVNSTGTSTYYSDPAYYSGNFTGITADIIYLRDISSFYPGDFSRCICSALVINNTTPPIWKNRNNMLDSEIINDPKYSKERVFSNSTISNIYVPDSAVSAYQTDTNWSSVANKIQPLSYLTKVATEADLLANQIALIEAYM